MRNLTPQTPPVLTRHADHLYKKPPKPSNTRKLVILGLIGLALIFIIVTKGNFFSRSSNPEHQLTSLDYKNPSSENSEEITHWPTYKNTTYGYQIKYPTDWQLFEDEANTDFSETTLNEKQKAKEGGAVFWSNKDSIDYTEETKPADFRLLGLLLYEKEDTTLDDLAKFLGFTEQIETESIPFKAENIIGKEYVSLGATEKEPRVAIIFQDSNRFYVFHLGFIGEDQETLKTMEQIVGSFRVGE